MKKKKRERGHSDKDFNSQRILDRELGKALRDVGLEEEHHGRKGSNKRVTNEVKISELRVSQELQMKLYESGDLQKMEAFFMAGGCFLQKVQRQITDDANMKVLELFLKYWEYMPSERRYMIKRKNLEFIGCYLQARSLGEVSEDLAKDASFPKSFVITYAEGFNKKTREILRTVRKINL